MKSRWLPQRLGPRLFLSYLFASLAGAVSGLAAAFFVPAQTYQKLMVQIMNPPPHMTLQQMDARLAAVVTRAIAVHVVVSLVVAIAVSIVIAAYVSREIAGFLGRLMLATRRLSRGRFAERVNPEGVYEIAELAQDVNRLAESLEQAEKRRSLVIASVGHELRTPLTALRVYCDGMRDGMVEMTPEVLARMSHSVDRLERMAGDLSSFARAEAAVHEDLTLSALPVLDVLQSAYHSVREAFEAAGVELRLEFAGTPDGAGAARGVAAPAGYVRADSVRLGEILENLLANSLAHTPQGKQVVLGARLYRHEVEIFVRDDGAGIRAEDLPHVVEPFYRGGGGSAGRTPRAGMGLGLAIVSRLVQAMGGRLVLDSPGTGKGTTASVFLLRVLSES